MRTKGGVARLPKKAEVRMCAGYREQRRLDKTHRKKSFWKKDRVQTKNENTETIPCPLLGHRKGVQDK